MSKAFNCNSLNTLQEIVNKYAQIFMLFFFAMKVYYNRMRDSQQICGNICSDFIGMKVS